MANIRSDPSKKKSTNLIEKSESINLEPLKNEVEEVLHTKSPKNNRSPSPKGSPEQKSPFKGRESLESESHRKKKDFEEEKSHRREKSPKKNESSEESEKGYNKEKQSSDEDQSKHEYQEGKSRKNSRHSSRDNKNQELALVADQEPKTFMTQKREEEKMEAAWTLNDLLFPGGKISKLCRIPNLKSKDIKISDILKRSGIIENNPVILLSGAEGDKRAGLLVGIARAAYSTDAVIIDNGLKSGIETACFRKKVKLVGVCPEEAIVYPTKNSTGDRLGELAAGHSHLFVMGTKGDGTRWDNVVPFKMELCDRIRKGRGGPGSFVCRGVCVLVGDNTGCLWEVEKALKSAWPVLVIEASPLGRDISHFLKTGAGNVPKTLQEPLKKGKVFVFPENGTAEHLASAVHLHLAISF